MYRQYVDVDHGQLHTTTRGTGRPIVLLPWFPLSAEMYAGEFDAFVERGWRVIAIDPLGQGNSPCTTRGLSIEAHAAAIGAALTALEAKEPVILGGHMGSQMAVALASDAAVGAHGVVLDGGPMVDAKHLEAIFAKMGRVPGALVPETGAPSPSLLFDQALNTYDIFSPGYTASSETLPIIYRFIRDYLNAYLPVGGATLTSDTPHGYDFAGAIADMSLPGVIVTSETEPLRSSFEPMCAAYGGALEKHTFPGGHPLHDPSRKGEFAAQIHGMLGKLGVAPN